MICRIDIVRSWKYIGPFEVLLLPTLVFKLPFQALSEPKKTITFFKKTFHQPVLHLHNKHI